MLVILQRKFPEFAKEELYAHILCGEVEVEGGLQRNPKQLVPVGAALQLLEPRHYVSRGGRKLEKAIEQFAPIGFVVEHLIGLDAGSSSGGFSDCLLQHGCAEVYAVDSGRNQLTYKLRCHPQVRSFEGYKIQNFLADLAAGRLQVSVPDFVVMDISFRSVLDLVPLALAVCRKHYGIILCKPQFEWRAFVQARPEYRRLDFSGIIAEDLAEEVYKWFCGQLRGIPLIPGETRQRIKITGTCPSPIRGGGREGNVEYLLFVQAEV